MKVLRILSERVYAAGYVVRRELWDTDGGEQEMTTAYTPDGSYIGTAKSARHIVAKRGVRPQLRFPDHTICTIGYNAAERKWYGWSHRTICGFRVGSVVTKGSAISKEEGGPFAVGFKAKTLADAKLMTEAFAESVG